MIRDFSAVLSSAVITFALQTSLLSKTADLRFQDLTIAEGLSKNTVRCLMQDSRGFM